MKLIWIEDVLTLAEHGSFARAAAVRNVSQSAFSRRIQALEDWLGVPLVDRSQQPVRLTVLGRDHLPELQRLLAAARQLRTRMQAAHQGVVRLELVTQHSLTMIRLPPVLESLLAQRDPVIELVVNSENRDDCVARFLAGEADLLLCMEEAGDLLHALAPEAERLALDDEVFVPVSAPNADGQPMHYPGGAGPLRLLIFPGDTFLGRVLHRNVLERLDRHQAILVVHRSVFLAGIKEMVLAGLGASWLPAGLVQRELAEGTLVEVPNMPSLRLLVGLYSRQRRQDSLAVDRLWQVLEAGRREKASPVSGAGG